jgi:hypothetical protein
MARNPRKEYVMKGHNVVGVIEKLNVSHTKLLVGSGVSFAVLPLLFNFALEYAIRKVQDNQVGLILNGTHQLLVYGDNMYLSGDNMDTIKKITETVIGASKEVGLEVNADKTKYMLLSHLKNARAKLSHKDR